MLSLRKLLYRSGALFIAIALLMTGFNTQPAHAQNAESLSGWFNILWADSADGVTSFQKYELQTDDGNSVRLLVDESVAEAWGGVLELNRKKVTVQGAWVLNATAPAFQVTSFSMEQTERSATRTVSGTQPWVSIMCYFNGESLPAAPYNTSAYFQNMYTNTYPGLDHYWRESSYNIINIVGSGTASAWVQLPKTFSQYVSDTSVPPDGTPDEFNSSLLFTDCTAAADSIVDYSGYAGINMMFNRDDLTGYALGGGKNATLDGVTKTWMTTWQPGWGYSNAAVMSHEMGHAFGLPHSSGNYGLTYDNQWDVMSDTWTNCSNSTDATYGCLGQHTNSYYKEKLGWITAGQKFTPGPAGGTTTITLERLAQPATANYLMAKILIGGSLTHFYTVEARKKIGYDVKLPGEAVIIHEVNTAWSSAPAHVIDPDLNGNTGDAGAMWTVGETFTDAANGISVSVLSSTATGFQISITSPAYTLAYCATSADTAAVTNYISRMQLNGGDQASTLGTNGYEDRTGASFTTLTKGSSYSAQVTGQSPLYSGLETVKIWVDFNKNGEFTDSGEELDLGSFNFSGTHLFSGNLPIPGNAVAGTTRMRVMLRYTNGGFPAPSSCATNGAGEAEDYTVTIANSKPEMNVKGNNVSIVDGDATPTLADFTNFSSANVTGGIVNRVFTIENLGNLNLTLSGTPKVVIGGANAADFTVVINPISPVVVSGSTTFTVHFDPSAAGVRTATVSIANNDSNENPYNFTITGTGSIERAKNGGFETYTTRPAIPTNWAASANFAATDGKNTTAMKDGLASVKLSGEGKIKTLSQTLTLSGVTGDKFTFSFWVKGASIPTTAGVCQGQVMLYNGPTAVANKIISCPTGTYAAFLQKTLTFNATSAYTSVVIKFTYSKASGTVWFDLASLLR